MRFSLAKLLEAAGVLVLLLALLAGLGLMPGGEARLSRQIALMLGGAVLFVAGWWIESETK